MGSCYHDGLQVKAVRPIGPNNILQNADRHGTIITASRACSHGSVSPSAAVARTVQTAPIRGKRHQRERAVHGGVEPGRGVAIAAHGRRAGAETIDGKKGVRNR